MIRLIFLTLAAAGSQALFTQPAVGQAGPPGPPSPPPAIADCPTKWIGEVGGLHQYETINCEDPTTTGFGQSVTEYPNPIMACNGNSCATPVQTILKLKRTVTPGNSCEASSLDEAKEKVRIGMTKFAVWQSRYSWSDSFWPSWLREVNENRMQWQEYLYDEDHAEDVRLEAFNAFYCENQSHALAADLATRNWGVRGVRKLKGINVDDLWPLLDEYPAQVNKTNLSYVNAAGNWKPRDQKYLRARADSGDFIYFQYVEMRRALQKFYIAFEIDEPAGTTTDITTVQFVETGKFRHLLNFEENTIFATTVTDLSL